MLTAELLAAFALLCGVVAVAIVAYGLLADDDAPVVADVLAPGESLEFEIAYAEAREERSYDPFPVGFDDVECAGEITGEELRAIEIAEGYAPCDCPACQAQLMVGLPANRTLTYYEPFAAARVARLDVDDRLRLRLLLATTDFLTPWESALDDALDAHVSREHLVAARPVLAAHDDIPF